MHDNVRNKKIIGPTSLKISRRRHEDNIKIILEICSMKTELDSTGWKHSSVAGFCEYTGEISDWL